MRLPKTKSLSVDLPPDLVGLLGPTSSEAVTELKRLALIDLYRRGEVSTGYAAEVLEISRWEFIQALGRHRVEYLEASDQDLELQFKAALPRRPHLQSSPSPTPAP